MKGFRFVLCVTVFFLGCAETFFRPDPDGSPLEIFDQVWNDYARHYARFAYKETDWDQVYRDYWPVFRIMQDHDTLLGPTLGGMLEQIEDSHAILITPEFTYGYQRPRGWENTLNFDYRLAVKYVNNPQRLGVFTMGPLDSSIAYLHIDHFKVSDDDEMAVIDHIIPFLKRFDGLILDLRDNHGGFLRHSKMAARRFADQERLCVYWRFRSGEGYDELTDPVPETVDPVRPAFTKPVVLLQNRNCASAAEDFIMRLRVCDHVKTMGDTTSGGLGGAPITRELPNGWLYRVPTAIEYSPEMEIFEGSGIPPNRYARNYDVYVRLGRDYILEQAMIYLKERL
ncbi:MAG TPA: hypothetical protein ENN03_05115 [bacterium]|mgnify:CR=1 FL=1|nr:hypothetical protein [bacterium]